MTNFNQKGMLDDSIYKEAGDLLAVGGWMIEMPKDGSHPRMYGNRQMHAIFEAPEDLSPEALFDFWFDRIISTFRESRVMIRQALAKGQVGRNSCYAWQHPSKGCVFIRARGAGGVSENGNTWLKGLVEVAETEFQFRMPEGKPFKVLEARKLQIYAPYFLETYEEIHEIDPVTLRVTPLSYRQDHYDPRPKDADLYELHRHESLGCMVSQREVGLHTTSFQAALRVALREDADIVVVGEMRDRETVRLALQAAETGHLVFATLHTRTAAQSVDRIISIFPEAEQAQMRMVLADTLKAVLSVSLMKRCDIKGRVQAMEIMLVNGAIRNLIREGKTPQINSVIQTSRGQGMCTMDDALKDLLDRAIISRETAAHYARDSDFLKDVRRI